MTAYRVVKRGFDLVVSSAVITLGLVPGAVLAVAVAKDTYGFPIFVQERIGHKGPFRCYKYRTMAAGADDANEFLTPEQFEVWLRERKLPDDPRVSKLGRFLRMTSIDEFPQFLNVFLGQMSIVGPRAIIAEELEGNFTPEERRRYLSVPSGITGAWQVGPRNNATWANGLRKAIEFDYIEHASIGVDAAIILKTFGTMFVRKTGL